MPRWVTSGVLIVVLLTVFAGCGDKRQEPVEKNEPMPRERFPKPDK